MAPILNAFIDAELESAGLTPDKLALVGFSQGTMTSLHVAPRRPAPIAGILGYSGAVLDGGTLGIETVSTPPVCLVHGTADEVVPFQAMAAAESGSDRRNAGRFARSTWRRPRHRRRRLGRGRCVSTKNSGSLACGKPSLARSIKL